MGADKVSWASNQPSPAEIVAPLVLVYVGGGSVLTDPVEVYDGRRVAATGGFSSVTGGYGYGCVCAAAIWPAPAPPVIHGRKELNVGPAGGPQTPTAFLGSLVIHPPWRPS